MSSIDVTRLKQFGILVAAAALYTGIGLALGLVIRRFTRPPVHFRNTLLAATSMGNWGDLTLAVVMGLGNSAPFNNGDSSLGVAYVSAFLCFSNVWSFTVGYYQIGQDQKCLDEELPSPTGSESSESTAFWDSQKDEDAARSPITPSTVADGGGSASIVVELNDYPPHNPPRSRSLSSAFPNVEDAESVATSLGKKSRIPAALRTYWKRYGLSKKQLDVIRSVCNLANLSVIFGLIFAITPFLKNLFIYTNPTEPHTIDHEPPFRFLFEVFEYVGAAGPPLGVINLGAALGRLSTKSMLPLNISLSITMTRLVIIPILGIALTQLFTYHISWIDPNDKILRFILMFQACCPTASATVFITQMFHPKGEANEIASVVLVQCTPSGGASVDYFVTTNGDQPSCSQYNKARVVTESDIDSPFTGVACGVKLHFYPSGDQLKYYKAGGDGKLLGLCQAKRTGVKTCYKGVQVAYIRGEYYCNNYSNVKNGVNPCVN
ncbi:Protein M3 [Rhizophlyctis rosea]|nr:Protein M3 [Rhizophlyctis rosea]